MPKGFNIERRSIEFIPEDERYRHPRRRFSFWFSCQMQVSTLVVGTLGIAAGLNLAWTALAIVLGNVIGTIFMAGHSAQGPHLGIPQMIQSRAQFGVLGAAIPLIIVVIIYVLFNAANAVVMRNSIEAVLPIGNDAAIIGFGAVTVAIGFSCNLLCGDREHGAVHGRFLLSQLFREASQRRHQLDSRAHSARHALLFRESA